MIFRNTQGRYEIDYIILLTLGGTLQMTSDISLRRPQKEK